MMTKPAGFSLKCLTVMYLLFIVTSADYLRQFALSETRHPASTLHEHVGKHGRNVKTNQHGSDQGCNYGSCDIQ